MNNFTNFRLKYADQYTAHPLTRMNTRQLEELAKQMNIPLEELKESMNTVSVMMTCPLCGQASTHLTSCKGCGICAWAEESDIIDRLREQMKAALADEKTNAGLNKAIAVAFPPITFTADQINHAASNAYHHGGCMLCEVCQRHTQTLADICPLRMLANRITNPDFPLPLFVQEALRLQGTEQEKQTYLSRWLRRVWESWCNYWNTTAQHSVLHWRTLLLFGAWKSEEDNAA